MAVRSPGHAVVKWTPIWDRSLDWKIGCSVANGADDYRVDRLIAEWRRQADRFLYALAEFGRLMRTLGPDHPSV